MYGRASNRGGRARGRGGGSRYNSKSTALKGLFKDNIWHCNCDPRLPAEHFKVKKEGKNQGRWFYTCQQQEPKRCDFFLWDEDARLRMESAVLAGKTEEVAHGAQEDWAAGRAQVREQPVGKGLFAGVANGTRSREDDEETLSPSPPPPYESHKRSARDAGLDSDDEAFPWPLTGAEEVQLSSSTETMAPTTPHKVQKTGVYATPAESAKRQLPWLYEHPAYTSAAARKQEATYFDSPSKSAAGVRSDKPSTPGIPQQAAVMPKSPSPPSRHKDALANPADSASSLTSEALAVLSSVAIPPDILSSLRSTLSKHDLRTQGVTKGRDISRLAVKAKDAKIGELQAKIASLEAEREMERGVRRLRGQKVAVDLDDEL